MQERRINPAIPILLVLLVLVSAFCVVLWVEKREAERDAQELRNAYAELKKANEDLDQENKDNVKKAESYLASYESLNKMVEEASRAEEAAKKKGEDYQEDYNNLVYLMYDDAAQTETMCNLIIDVWHNAIYEVSDSETDKYTKVRGRFVSDFNDALANLYSDDDFSEQLNALIENQQWTREEMKNMTTPPEGFDKAYNALEEVYRTYLSFTNLVIYLDGSYNSFSDDFGKLDKDFVASMNAAALYVK